MVEATAALALLFDALTEDEVRVLIRRVGLHDGRMRTLQEIAVELGWGQGRREKVRRLEASGLDVLRNRCRQQFVREAFVAAIGQHPDCWPLKRLSMMVLGRFWRWDIAQEAARR